MAFGNHCANCGGDGKLQEQRVLQTVPDVTIRFCQDCRNRLREQHVSLVKAGIEAARARGVVFGNPNGSFGVSTEAARKGGKIGVVTRRRNSLARAKGALEVIGELQASGVTSLSAIARALTERGVPTSEGGAAWHATTVKRLLHLNARQ